MVVRHPQCKLDSFCATNLKRGALLISIFLFLQSLSLLRQMKQLTSDVKIAFLIRSKIPVKRTLLKKSEQTISSENKLGTFWVQKNKLAF